MSNNQFCNNFDGRTFQNNFMPPMSIPPPPLPPPLFIVPETTYTPSIDILDQEYVKTFENKALNTPVKRTNSVSISQVRNKLRDLVMSLNELKSQERDLQERLTTCSEEEWKNAIDEVNHNKELINNLLMNINTFHMDTLKKLIAKRAAKRLRLKRLRIENNRIKEDRMKELKEKSRKIDENLQKIKDAINKAKQDEEIKLQADMVLKEVLRMKHNAKKFIAKLDALKKLRNARVTTAKGRGANVSTTESAEFDEKIDKLKLLWAQKLIVYEKEEEELRAKLDEDNNTKATEVNEMEKQVASNLRQWRKVLFGDEDASPQVNFNGDLRSFVAIRSQWDMYASESGSSLPVGWVTPAVQAHPQ